MIRQCLAVIAACVLCVLLFSACTSSRYAPHKMNKEFNYFQTGLDSLQKISFAPLTVKPNDLLYIQVSSATLNQDQVAIFNAANFGGSAAMMNPAILNQQQAGGATVHGFLVDEQGNIKYPMFGSIPVAGLTREQLELKMENLFKTKELVKDPVVSVRFLQLRVNVLGEVKVPGTKSFVSDRITIFDALSAAGDLNERGRRDNIIVIREENGLKKYYTVNLLSTDFINTPGFQLQQNDVVYVSANKIKLKETNFDPQFQRDLQIVLSIASGLSFLINIFLLFKN